MLGVMRRWIAVGCVGALLIGGGVAIAALGDDDAPCPSGGERSGLMVQMAPADRRADRVTVCADGQCTAIRRRATALFVPIDADGPERVGVVAVLERDGAPVEVRSTVVTLRKHEPNGPGCGTWWTGKVSTAALPEDVSRGGEQYLE